MDGVETMLTKNLAFGKQSARAAMVHNPPATRQQAVSTCFC